MSNLLLGCSSTSTLSFASQGMKLICSTRLSCQQKSGLDATIERLLHNFWKEHDGQVQGQRAGGLQWILWELFLNPAGNKPLHCRSLPKAKSSFYFELCSPSFSRLGKSRLLSGSWWSSNGPPMHSHRMIKGRREKGEKGRKEAGKAGRKEVREREREKGAWGSELVREGRS